MHLSNDKPNEVYKSFKSKENFLNCRMSTGQRYLHGEKIRYNVFLKVGTM